MSDLPAMNADALREELAPPWRTLDVVAETGSTNADLLARAAAGEDIDGAVLIAEHQSAGRGRHGRSWVGSPRAALTLSVGVAADDVDTDAWGWLTLATGVAVVDALVAEAQVDAGLKWPNDVLADGKKLAGILSEVAAPRKLIVVGVGLNVASPGEQLAEGATSLTDLGVAAPDRHALASRLLRELGERVAAWRGAGGADERLMTDYRDRSVTIGSQVRVVLPGDRELVGVASGIDDRGRLCLESGEEAADARSGKTTVAVSAGDVVHLRPIPRQGI